MLKFASLLDTLEDLTTVYAGAPIEIKAEAQDDRLLLLQALEAEGAPDAVVSDAESVSRDVPARRRQTAMPAPQPSAKRLCNDQLAPEAADVDWVFGIGIPEKNAQSVRIDRHYLQFCLRHIKSHGKPCANKELAKACHACEWERPQFPHLFERRPDWLMWSAANVTVRPIPCRQKLSSQAGEQYDR